MLTHDTPAFARHQDTTALDPNPAELALLLIKRYFPDAPLEKAAFPKYHLAILSAGYEGLMMMSLVAAKDGGPVVSVLAIAAVVLTNGVIVSPPKGTHTAPTSQQRQHALHSCVTLVPHVAHAPTGRGRTQSAADVCRSGYEGQEARLQDVITQCRIQRGPQQANNATMESPRGMHRVDSTG